MRRAAWWLGVIVQGTVLGIGLAVALLKLLEFSSGTRLFRYQGF
jgi:hypothetical protein